MRAPLVFLCLFACALIAAGCGSGDENRFESDDVPFTFTYPDGWEERSSEDFKGDKKVLAWLSLTPLDVITFSKVSDEPVPIKRVVAEVSYDLSRQLDRRVAGKLERHSNMVMGSFEVPYATGGKRTRSHLYYFTKAGAVWQLECQSTRDKRNQVELACEQVVDSLEFTKS